MFKFIKRKLFPKNTRISPKGECFKKYIEEERNGIKHDLIEDYERAIKEFQIKRNVTREKALELYHFVFALYDEEIGRKAGE